MLPPLSLYIHIPWCEKKCPYCDFNSHQAKTDINESAYIDALLSDLRQDLHTYRDPLQGRELKSIFIGGGTPSLFSASAISQLMQGVRAEIKLAPNCEVTMEANPGSSEADKFSGFREAGINRLSIGVQSFNPLHLSKIGRVHNASEAIAAARFAGQAGFDNFNLDLMFGLPEQSIEQCLQDITTAIELAPTHLSCYQLTIEPNTLFHHQPPPRPDDDALWEMQTALQEILAAADYRHYEVSAYAQAERRCEHNLNYWQFGDYLGIGAGAHGKITQQSHTLERYWKIKHPTSYLRAASESTSFVGAAQKVAADQISFEFMINALRLVDGFEIDLFTRRTGLNYSAISNVVDKHQRQGLLIVGQQHLKPSEKGQQFLDSMLQDYLPA